MSFKRVISTILLFLLFAAGNIFSEVQQTFRKNRFSFNIRYLGMKIAEVELTDNIGKGEGNIIVKANSVGLGNILFKIDNQYETEYIDDYLSIIYSKSIQQKNFTQERKNYLKPSEKKVETLLDGKRSNYSLPGMEDARDFFSALLYLRNTVAGQTQRIQIYANNNIWSAQISYLGEDKIKKKDTLKYRIDFQQISRNKKQRSDVLTNNIVKEDGALYLWFSNDDDRLFLQAEYEASPFSVFWTLEDHLLATDVEESGFKEDLSEKE